MSLNKVMLMGNLGVDPVIREMEDGSQYAFLSLATNESWTDAQGNKHQRSDWHRVVIWNKKLVGVARDYMKKGSKLLVEGTLRYRRFLNDEGREITVPEIVLLRGRGALHLINSKRSESLDSDQLPSESISSASV